MENNDKERENKRKKTKHIGFSFLKIFTHNKIPKNEYSITQLKMRWKNISL